jgi:hypothetical protein
VAPPSRKFVSGSNSRRLARGGDALVDYTAWLLRASPAQIASRSGRARLAAFHRERLAEAEAQAELERNDRVAKAGRLLLESEIAQTQGITLAEARRFLDARPDAEGLIRGARRSRS